MKVAVAERPKEVYLATRCCGGHFTIVVNSMERLIRCDTCKKPIKQEDIVEIDPNKITKPPG